MLSVNVWLQHRTLAFPSGTSVKDRFLNFLDISESNQQDTSSESQIDETHFCKVRAVWGMFMTLPLKLLQQGCYLLGCVGSWHLWDSHLFGPMKKHLGGHRCQTECGSAWCWCSVQVVLFTQPTVLCWRRTLPDNMLWWMNEPTGWLFGEVGHCSLFSFGMLKLLNKQIVSMYSYFQICHCNLSAVIHLWQYAW